ncbi:hypothetical protein ZWY2020_033442 [Hordeum vulgare]|nr:hypothetical protein ZWY2020_033442 [Hordeum vulgare]
MAAAAAVSSSAPAVSCLRLVLPGFSGLVHASLLAGRARGRGVSVRSGAAPPDPAAMLRRPAAATTAAEEREADADAKLGSPVDDEEPEEGRRRGPQREWVDWEDLILEDTVPLVGFVRMILHSGKYSSGERVES